MKEDESKKKIGDKKMSDTTDDMEYDLARTFCRECKKHIEECECKKLG